MPNGEVEEGLGVDFSNTEIDFDFPWDISDIPDIQSWGAEGGSWFERLLELIKSGTATPQSVAQVFGLQAGEYDPDEFRMPTQQQIEGMRAGTYLPELTDITGQYQIPGKQQGLGTGTMAGGMRTSTDRLRETQLANVSPYGGAMRAGQESVKRSVATAEADVSGLIADWISRAKG